MNQQRALDAVESATGEQFADVRTALLSLAEDGAFDEYVGDGCFETTYQSMHIDEMDDEYIARLLIREYE